MPVGDQFSVSVRDAVIAVGVERLAITDLVDADLALIGWSGSPLHVRHVASELERAASGEAEHLTVRAPDGKPIAKCGIDLAAFSGVGVIHQLATRADLQGLGIGTRLSAAAEARIRARGLTTAMVSVEPDNPQARALYERLGYLACGQRSASWECHGQPCIRDTRVLVTVVLDALAAGLSPADIVSHYPTINEDGVRAAVAYGAWLAKQEIHALHARR